MPPTSCEQYEHRWHVSESYRSYLDEKLILKKYIFLFQVYILIPLTKEHCHSKLPPTKALCKH